MSAFNQTLLLVVILNSLSSMKESPMNNKRGESNKTTGRSFDVWTGKVTEREDGTNILKLEIGLDDRLEFFEKLQRLNMIEESKGKKVQIDFFKFDKNIFDKFLKFDSSELNIILNEMPEDIEFFSRFWKGSPLLSHLETNKGVTIDEKFEFFASTLSHHMHLFNNKFIIFDFSRENLLVDDETNKIVITQLRNYDQFKSEESDILEHYNNNMDEMVELLSEMFPLSVIKMVFDKSKNVDSMTENNIIKEVPKSIYTITLKKKLLEKLNDQNETIIEGEKSILEFLKEVLKEGDVDPIDKKAKTFSISILKTEKMTDQLILRGVDVKSYRYTYNPVEEPSFWQKAKNFFTGCLPCFR